MLTIDTQKYNFFINAIEADANIPEYGVVFLRWLVANATSAEEQKLIINIIEVLNNDQIY